jgi:hypothetical protein
MTDLDEQEYRTIGAVLDDLSGHGVYDIAIVEEQFTTFGFTYNRATDRLGFAGGSERLGVASKDQVERTMARDPKGGILDQGTPDGARLVDAGALARAVHKLLMPGKTPPGDMYMGRGKSFRANVDSILAYEAIKDPLAREN